MSVLTESGPCYKLTSTSSSHSTSGGHEAGNLLGHFLQRAKRDLNLSLTLTGTTSSRVGFPTINSTIFGRKYLCLDHFGDSEAEVICRQMGFKSGGKMHKFVPGTEQSQLKSINIYGLGVNCTGNEDHLLQCEGEFEGINGESLFACER